MRADTWTNADGLEVGFGTSNTKNKEAGSIETKGRVRQVELEVYYDVPVTSENVKSAVIPAGAHILSADLVVSTAFAGGTNVAVGTIKTDGTSGDADALVDETLTASLTENAVITGAGATVGTVLADDVQLTYTPTGAFTAGRGTVVVEYVIASAK